LVAAFVRALQPETVLETGSAFGQTAEAIGRALAANGCCPPFAMTITAPFEMTM
jgi:hypothetical protein